MLLGRLAQPLLGLALFVPVFAQAPPWKPADPSYRLSLPRDHAAHPEHKIEWWYYTGNVATRDGRRFGFQLTFFRFGVDPSPANPSRWAVRDLYMAHLAVSDLSGRRHRFADRLNRAGPGLAGADTDSYRVWNEDWLATTDASGRHVLRARDRGLGVDLVLEPGKPWVGHGVNGFSQKGASAGNASHYYSLTRMPARGVVTIEGEPFEVEGLGWMDHEFGSSFLDAGQVGWDWFSIQLDDGADLMLYGMRRADGSRDPYASGTHVDSQGGATALRAGDFVLGPGERWLSPENGAGYPVAWRVEVPGQRLVLDVGTALPAQELRTERSTRVSYWEGAIEVTGTRAGRPVRGLGYLEMTGYAGPPLTDVLR